MGTSHIRYVHGVDFSGAKDAGDKIWVTTGFINGKVLEIGHCRPAKELPLSGRKREECLRALIEFISKEKEAIFGMDFPFGLPAPLAKKDSWKSFVLAFAKRFRSPEEFKKECLATGNNKEIKRITDEEQRTPFSPYNLWLYKQTYYGIRDVISPLVRDEKAIFPPMQKMADGKAWVIEICPAVTLKRNNLYFPYKGKTSERYNQRVKIFKEIGKIGKLKISLQLKERILNDDRGDALDSVIAAFAAFCNLLNIVSKSVNSNPNYKMEGYVYP